MVAFPHQLSQNFLSIVETSDHKYLFSITLIVLGGLPFSELTALSEVGKDRRLSEEAGGHGRERWKQKPFPQFSKGRSQTQSYWPQVGAVSCFKSLCDRHLLSQTSKFPALDSRVYPLMTVQPIDLLLKISYGHVHCRICSGEACASIVQIRKVPLRGVQGYTQEPSP